MQKKSIPIRRFCLFIFFLAIILALFTSQTTYADVHASHSLAYVKSKYGNGKQQTLKINVTWYGFDDNSGETESQKGSAIIAYPKKDGNPTLHNQATEGKGTYTDPVTSATPDQNLNIFPIGSIIYVPFVQKYFIMEDQCYVDPTTSCAPYPHLDLFMGPSSASDWPPLKACEDNSTPGPAVPLVINPAPNLTVDTTPMFKDNKCTIKKHSNTITTSGKNPGSGNPGGSNPGSGNPGGSNPGTDNTQSALCPTTSNTSVLWSGSLDSANWEKTWGINAGAPATIGLSNLAPASDPTGTLSSKVLQASYPSTASPPTNAEEQGTTYGSQFLTDIKSKTGECLYLSYYVLFPKGFDFANGGKLPGLYGGNTIYGATAPNGTNGFSVRLMWTDTGGGGVCAYLPTGSSIAGAHALFDGHNTSIGENSWKFAADGQWHHVEMGLALNTNSIDKLSNGSINVWYDNQNVLTATGVKFRTPGTTALQISGLFFSTFLNSLRKNSTIKLAANAQVDFADFQADTALIAGDSKIQVTQTNTGTSDTGTSNTGTPDTGTKQTGSGGYDLSLKIVPGTTTPGTRTYQIQVSNLSGSVQEPIILDLVVLGNKDSLQLTSLSSDSNWVIVSNSSDRAPRLEATYTGSYPVADSATLSTITITLTGTISAGADLFGWVDISGTSGDSDFSNNVVSQGLV